MKKYNIRRNYFHLKITYHHCKLIEAWAGDAGTEDEHKKTVYLCDDGVKYYR